MNILRIKNLILASAALAALTLAGCAKSEKTEDNEAELRYLEAWVQVNHPDAQKTELGAYIIEDTPGKGETFEGDKFAILQYNIESVDGTISATTDKKIAQQIGKYNKSYYYGNVVWAAYKGVITEGVLDAEFGLFARLDKNFPDVLLLLLEQEKFDVGAGILFGSVDPRRDDAGVVDD